MKRRKRRAQAQVSGVFVCSKQFVVRGLGLFFFLVGSFFIIASYFKIPITGHVVSDSFVSTSSIAGILLEIIGITLMAIKFDTNNNGEQ